MRNVIWIFLTTLLKGLVKPILELLGIRRKSDPQLDKAIEDVKKGDYDAINDRYNNP